MLPSVNFSQNNVNTLVLPTEHDMSEGSRENKYRSIDMLLYTILRTQTASRFILVKYLHFRDDIN